MFDRVVVVDWSANARPKRGRDSIWIAVAGDGERTMENPSTRASASARLATLLAEPGRTLLAVDFSLGYPAGTADALGLSGTPWRAMWQLLAGRIVDSASNANNRFAVAAELNQRMTGRAAPFWGRPARAAWPTLAATRPVDGGGIATWRTVETVLRAAGHRPFSSWQLLGAGAVGSQSLVGIAALARLVGAQGGEDGGNVAVWPFTTGLAPPAPADHGVVIAEVWPSMFIMRPRTDATASAPVRDAVQVRHVADELWARDRRDDLAGWFAPEVPAGTTAAVVGEEGWVLGVPHLLTGSDGPIGRA